MDSIKVRSISKGLLSVLVLFAFLYLFIPFCFLWASDEDWFLSKMDLTTCLISIFVCIPTIAILIYATLHYRKQAIINTSGICIKNPLHKEITIPKDKLTAFGEVHFAPRDTKLYFCNAPSEHIWTFYQEHLEDCKRVFRNLPYQEYSVTRDGQWAMAVGIYVFYRQDGVYFLENSKAEYLVTIEKLLEQDAISIDICKNLFKRAGDGSLS